MNGKWSCKHVCTIVGKQRRGSTLFGGDPQETRGEQSQFYRDDYLYFIIKFNWGTQRLAENFNRFPILYIWLLYDYIWMWIIRFNDIIMFCWNNWILHNEKTFTNKIIKEVWDNILCKQESALCEQDQKVCAEENREYLSGLWTLTERYLAFLLLKLNGCNVQTYGRSLTCQCTYGVISTL